MSKKFQLPRQQISMKLKTKAWGIKHFTAIDKTMFSDGSPFRTLREQKIKNFKSYNGDLSIEDYNITLNQIGRAHV